MQATLIQKDARHRQAKREHPGLVSNSRISIVQGFNSRSFVVCTVVSGVAETGGLDPCSRLCRISLEPIPLFQAVSPKP